MTAPILAVTVGDPAGIGPELVACAAAHTPDHGESPSWRLLAVGDAAAVRRGVAATGLDLAVRLVDGGEGGAFGREELDVIGPACEETAAEGAHVTGSVPADSVFHQGLRGRFDAVLSHFNDQGHIAAKTWDFEWTVAVTTGLPILRTSVDHGTAFDVAGTGRASARTLLAALDAAARFAPCRDRLRALYG